MDVIRDKHMATVDGYDRRRCYDRVIQCHDGSYIGLEVKSGSASLNEHQRTFDALVSPANPARIVHKGETISIIGVEYQQVPRQEI